MKLRAAETTGSESIKKKMVVDFQNWEMVVSLIQTLCRSLERLRDPGGGTLIWLEFYFWQTFKNSYLPSSDSDSKQ